MSTVNDSLDLSDIGLPGSAGLAVGVGYVMSENYALSANFTFSQLLHLLGLGLVRFIHQQTLLYHKTFVIAIGYEKI